MQTHFACQCNWLTSWMIRLKLCVFVYANVYMYAKENNKRDVFFQFDKTCKKIVRVYVKLSSFYEKLEQLLLSGIWNSKSKFTDSSMKTSNMYIQQLLSQLINSLGAFSLYLSILLQFWIQFTHIISRRERWAITRVHRASNHWHEMMIQSTGRRSIHFQIWQIQAVNHFEHIHATTSTHGIWKIMHIYRGNWLKMIHK